MILSKMNKNCLLSCLCSLILWAVLECPHVQEKENPPVINLETIDLINNLQEKLSVALIGEDGCYELSYQGFLARGPGKGIKPNIDNYSWLIGSKLDTELLKAEAKISISELERGKKYSLDVDDFTIDLWIEFESERAEKELLGIWDFLRADG